MQENVSLQLYVIRAAANPEYPAMAAMPIDQGAATMVEQPLSE
jgi:hypothetical protein